MYQIPGGCLGYGQGDIRFTDVLLGDDENQLVETVKALLNQATGGVVEVSCPRQRSLSDKYSVSVPSKLGTSNHPRFPYTARPLALT